MIRRSSLTFQRAYLAVNGASLALRGSSLRVDGPTLRLEKSKLAVWRATLSTRDPLLRPRASGNWTRRTKVAPVRCRVATRQPTGSVGKLWPVTGESQAGELSEVWPGFCEQSFCLVMVRFFRADPLRHLLGVYHRTEFARLNCESGSVVRFFCQLVAEKLKWGCQEIKGERLRNRTT
jgi:hypothetical protein